MRLPSTLMLLTAALALSACESPREDPATERPRDTVQPVSDDINRSPDADAGVTARNADGSRAAAPPADTVPAETDAADTPPPVDR